MHRPYAARALSLGRLNWVPWSCERDVGLERLLVSTTIAIGLSLFALTAVVIAPSITDYLNSRHNLERIERFRLVLEAANRISAERGPANVMMSIATDRDGSALARLTAFRFASDTALAALAGEYALAADTHTTSVPAQRLMATFAQLGQARKDVDRVAKLAAEERSLQDVSQAVAHMIAAADTFEGVVGWEIREIGQSDPALVGPAFIGHLVSDLREFGGRIGSAIIPAVAVRHALTTQQLAEASQMRGRILELLHLLRSQALFGPGQPLEGMFHDVETKFASQGLALIEAIVAEGRVSGKYSLTAEELTERYVPTLKWAETLRDRYIGGMVERFSIERDVMRTRLIGVAVGLVVNLSLLMLLLQSLRASVLRPLLSAREIVMALSQDDLPRAVSSSGGHLAQAPPGVRIVELHRLFSALTVLEERMRERARLIEKLRDQAETDGLTGISNRRGLALALKRFSDGPAGHAVSALMLDLDGFKKINDTLGHQGGDTLIRRFSERLCGSVYGLGHVARMGGDEFAILLPGIGEPTEAAAVAEKILNSLSEPFVVCGQTIYLGTSIGVAISPLHCPPTDELLACADMALYEAKRGGRHCHRIFSPALRDSTMAWTMRQQELPRALAEGEFELFYQPQVHLGHRRIVGAEALLRWRHPRLGLLNPSDFLAPLEASRHSASVARWVLSSACIQAAAWRAAGATDLRIGVNLSSVQIHAKSFVDEVRSALADSGLPACALELEITETIILEHDEALIAPLLALRELGVGIAFDDFGTGYASLSLLKRFPLTRLKIDRSFVQGMDSSLQDRAIIQSVLMLGRSFDLAVIAEGVETEFTARRLQAKGCEEAQGYLFGRPMPADAFKDLYWSTIKGPIEAISA